MDGLKFYAVSGTGYERSYKLGKLFATPIQRHIKRVEDILKDTEVNRKLLEVKENIQFAYADVLEEIFGKADGAGVNRDAYLLFCCGTLINTGTGCSSLIYRDDNLEMTLIHNEDDGYEPDEYAVVRHETDHGYYCGLETYYTIPGSWYTWNSRGLFFAMNYVKDITVNETGVPNYVLLRSLLESKSIDEVIKRCSKLVDRGKLANGFHLNILDTGQKKAMSLEVSSLFVVPKEIDCFNVHTNHYLSEKICHGQVYVDSDSNSVFRLLKINELAEKYLQIQDEFRVEKLKEIFDYQGESTSDSILAIRKDAYQTLATVRASSKDNNVLIHDRILNKMHQLKLCLHLNEEPLESVFEIL